MVRRRVSAVSNHVAPLLRQPGFHPSRRPLCGLLRMRVEQIMTQYD
jgi:hypothetical protein